MTEREIHREVRQTTVIQAGRFIPVSPDDDYLCFARITISLGVRKLVHACLSCTSFLPPSPSLSPLPLSSPHPSPTPR